MKKDVTWTMCMLAVLMLACNPKDKNVPSDNQNTNTSISDFNIIPGILSLKSGESDILLLSISTNDAVEWKSSNEAVASVADGTVTANSMGECTISATIGSKSAYCTVYVLNSSGKSVTLSPYNINLKKGESYQLNCQTTYTFDYKWHSDNPAAVTVDDKGLVQALHAGVAKVWVNNGEDSAFSIVAVEHNWGEYKMVWSDEFEGTELNTANWNVEVVSNPANNELQYYTDRTDNVRVADGNLLLEARLEDYGNKHYTSGRINSKGKQSFKYGKIEARINFPSGGGTWPAFWMLGNKGTWPRNGEIDIVEHMGNQPNYTSFAVHTEDKNGMKGTNWHAGYTASSSMENEYHIYGIEWIEEAENGCDVIKFLVDNVEYAATKETLANFGVQAYWPFQQEHYIIFNLAIGGLMGGKVADDCFDKPVIMKVDWVRVWQREEIE